MATNASSRQINNAPSVRERIEALYNHSELFEMTAGCPQLGIHETFGREWALCLAHVEGEVHQCGRVVEDFLRKNAQREELSPSEAEYKSAMNNLVNSLLLHERIVKTSPRMSSSTPPSMASMNKYRINSLVNKTGMRSANGELASMYGQEGDPIPSNLAAVDDEGLPPMALFIRDWLLNPLVDVIATPSQDLLMRLPVYRRRYQEEEEQNSNGRVINSNTVSAAANAFVYVLAILILIAPIATFTVVKEQSLRIIIMPLFCLLLAGSAQLMGSDAMPWYTIVIGYFQAMIFFVGSSNDG
ncbi:unnamed protein product [Alternaria burnsii]|nr:unnamed protein product [Alternaria burnsii]